MCDDWGVWGERWSVEDRDTLNEVSEPIAKPNTQAMLSSKYVSAKNQLPTLDLSLPVTACTLCKSVDDVVLISRDSSLFPKTVSERDIIR